MIHFATYRKRRRRVLKWIPKCLIFFLRPNTYTLITRAFGKEDDLSQAVSQRSNILKSVESEVSIARGGDDFGAKGYHEMLKFQDSRGFDLKTDFSFIARMDREIAAEREKESFENLEDSGIFHF